MCENRTGCVTALEIFFLTLSVLVLFFPSIALSETFLHDPVNTLFGRIEKYTVEQDESLIEVARNFNIGFNALEEANPLLDPFVPGAGATVFIPMQWILPEGMTLGGIVVNLSEFRLYYMYTEEGENFVATFPIGIGDEGKQTPLGRFRIIQKLEKPSWVPPPSVRAEDPSLPGIVPPGPENPLGSHALRLSRPRVLIHGTHRPFGVGRKVSHGCIRLYPEDIPMLYKMVQKGTMVTVVRQPVKAGMSQGRVYLQAHRDEKYRGDYLRETVKLLKKKGLYDKTSLEKVRDTLKLKNGMPTDITEDKMTL